MSDTSELPPSGFTEEAAMVKPRPSELYFGRTEIAGPFTETADQQQSQAPEPAQVEPDQAMVDQSALNFAIEVVGGRNLAEDIAKAAEWNNGKGIFHRWQDKVRGALAASYPIYLHLLVGGAAALEEVFKQPNFPPRQRRHRTNLALIALQFVARPEDGPQNKALSDYAKFLTYAALTAVAPDGFSARMSAVTLKSCKTLIQARAKDGSGCTLASESAAGAVADDARSTGEQTGLPANTPAMGPQVLGDSSPAEPAMPMIASIGPDERVQSEPVPSLTITVIGEAGPPRSLQCDLSPDEAQAVIARLDDATLGGEPFRNASHALEALMEVLKRPERQ